MTDFVTRLAETMSLSSILGELRSCVGSFEIVDHWQQGEFHHDTVIHFQEAGVSRFLVVATNCNGGVKEVLLFPALPQRYALWHSRCPHVADFSGDLPELLARSTTFHWFDPCALLTEDARSELLPEHRVRQKGGGWEPAAGTSARCGVARKGSTE